MDFNLIYVALNIIYSDSRILTTLILTVLYILYYRKFKSYHFEQNKGFTKGKHLIGKTVPAYPNGWFIIMKSEELKVGETKYVDLHGEHMVVFRGTNGQSYVLDAYCAHMGANLGINGTVTNESCVQCPFHGWSFDGETGNCVIGIDKKPKEAIRYEYEIGDKCELKAGKKEQVKIRKFKSVENSGYIYVWFHAEESKRMTPEYDILDIEEFTKRLEFRGTSINKVNSLLQDITENGGDVLHFQYVHSNIIPYLVTGIWDAKWIRGDDPDLYKKMELPHKLFNDHRMKIMKKYLNDQNKKYIGVMHLESQLSILGTKHFTFFSLVAFQLGPGIVYLFIKGLFFETMLVHYVKSLDKHVQHVYHDIYSSGYIPYWFSALQLYLEAQQVLNDGVVWDNKKFGISPYFSDKNYSDNTLVQWRQWYSQFYDGCKKYEEGKDNLNW